LDSSNAKAAPRSDRSRPITVGRTQQEKIGAARYDLSDPYHLALTMGWPAFLGLAVAAFVSINLVFATLYFLAPGSVDAVHSCMDAFFFSIETLATVGYGAMHPLTTYGHWVASAEILVGMAFTAIITGLIFVRFSKPRAKILCADVAVITRYNGCQTLMIRIGNGRMTLLTDLVVRLSGVLPETSAEGHTLRRVHDLELSRSRFAVFALTLILMHEINERSPLAGFDLEKIAQGDIRLFLSMEARDQALGVTVFDMRDYLAAQLRYGMKYADSISIDANGRTRADLTRINLVEPDNVPA
jgi:inward rectifier potassium channel